MAKQEEDQFGLMSMGPSGYIPPAAASLGAGLAGVATQQMALQRQLDQEQELRRKEREQKMRERGKTEFEMGKTVYSPERMARGAAMMTMPMGDGLTMPQLDKSPFERVVATDRLKDTISVVDPLLTLVKSGKLTPESAKSISAGMKGVFEGTPLANMTFEAADTATSSIRDKGSRELRGLFSMFVTLQANNALSPAEFQRLNAEIGTGLVGLNNATTPAEAQTVLDNALNRVFRLNPTAAKAAGIAPAAPARAVPAAPARAVPARAVPAAPAVPAPPAVPAARPAPAGISVGPATQRGEAAGEVQFPSGGLLLKRKVSYDANGRQTVTVEVAGRLPLSLSQQQAQDFQNKTYDLARKRFKLAKAGFEFTKKAGDLRRAAEQRAEGRSDARLELATRAADLMEAIVENRDERAALDQSIQLLKLLDPTFQPEMGVDDAAREAQLELLREDPNLGMRLTSPDDNVKAQAEGEIKAKVASRVPELRARKLLERVKNITPQQILDKAGLKTVRRERGAAPGPRPGATPVPRPGATPVPRPGATLAPSRREYGFN